jgi:hypothetical protein
MEANFSTFQAERPRKVVLYKTDDELTENRRTSNIDSLSNLLLTNAEKQAGIRADPHNFNHAV